MACGKMGRSVTKRLSTLTSTEIFEPYTDWMLGIGVDSVQMVLKRKNLQTSGGAAFNVKPAIQTAEVRPDNPDAFQDIANGGTYTGAGEDNTTVMTVSSYTGVHLWVRFGVTYYLSGGTPPVSGQADVELQCAWTSCGSLVGTMSQELQAYNTTTNSFVAITGWVPAVDADKVFAVFSIAGLSGSFNCQLAYRAAATSIQSPGSWNLLGSAKTSNGETATAEIALTLGSYMFVQFGLAFNQSTANQVTGQATVATAVAVRKT